MPAWKSTAWPIPRPGCGRWPRFSTARPGRCRSWSTSVPPAGAPGSGPWPKPARWRADRGVAGPAAGRGQRVRGGGAQRPDGGELARVAAHCALAKEVFDVLRPLCEAGEPVFSIGGSAFQDQAARFLPDGALNVLRSGCYVVHDHGTYAEVSPVPGLTAAAVVRALVVSVPEPGLAVLNAGKRELAYDAGLPVIVAAYRQDAVLAGAARHHGQAVRPPRRGVGCGGTGRGDVAGPGHSQAVFGVRAGAPEWSPWTAPGWKSGTAAVVEPDLGPGRRARTRPRHSGGVEDEVLQDPDHPVEWPGAALCFAQSEPRRPGRSGSRGEFPGTPGPGVLMCWTEETVRVTPTPAATRPRIA